MKPSLSLLVLTCILLLSGVSFAESTRTSIKLKSVTKKSHKWFRYDFIASNSRIEESEDPSKDISLFAKLYVDLPWIVRTPAGDLSTSLGIWPDFDRIGDEATYSLENESAVMANKFKFRGKTSPLTTLHSNLYIDTVDPDGPRSDSFLFVYGLTQDIIISKTSKVNSYLGLKFYADGDTPIRYSISTKWQKQFTKKLAVDLIRNETRYRGDEFLRFRFGPRVVYSFGPALTSRLYIYGDPSRAKDYFGAYLGLSGRL